MTTLTAPPQKIAIIGAGFTGVALTAALHRYARQPLEIYLFEKTGQFGAGDAYRTPYSWHLLNARAGDMSALEDDSGHFVRWLECHAATYLETDVPHGRQFLPRVLYHQYLCSLMANIFQDDGGSIQLHLVPEEVVDMEIISPAVKITLKHQQTMLMDQVVLAHGNNPPARLPCPMSAEMHYIGNPWDYTALKSIPSADPVLIVGTGLSMVDAVLTLHHKHHQGKIYAVSRRGLLPLPHTDNSLACAFDAKELPQNLLAMIRMIRSEARKLSASGGDWRAIIQQMRQHLPDIWQKMSDSCKRRFLRHLLPYWNIHRHRVHEKIHNLLLGMRKKGQLEVLAGNLVAIDDDQVQIRKRRASDVSVIHVRHVINCLGSCSDVIPEEQQLLDVLTARGDIQLDTLRLGLSVTSQFALKTKAGDNLPSCYTLGPPLRGELWESVAVPEIRKQCKDLAQSLLSEKYEMEMDQQVLQTLTVM